MNNRNAPLTSDRPFAKMTGSAWISWRNSGCCWNGGPKQLFFTIFVAFLLSSIPVIYATDVSNHDTATEFQSSENDAIHESLPPPALRTRNLVIAPIQRLNFYLGDERSLRHDGLRRWFMEHRPATLPASPALVIVLHWGLGNMRSSALVGRFHEKNPWLELAWDQGFLVLAPSGTGIRKEEYTFLGMLRTRGFRQDWNDLLGGGPSATGADDVGFIAALIDWAVAERNVDRSRVYVTGISAGGTMTQRLVIERPELFAGAAPFVANLPERDIPLPSLGTPIFLMNGTNDTFIPYNGGATTRDRGVVRSAEATRDFFVAANQAGPDMVETLLPDTDPDDGCRIVSQYFPSDTAPVYFYRCEGGGHQPSIGKEYPIIESLFLEQPGAVGITCHDVDSATLAWAFMSQYTRS